MPGPINSQPNAGMAADAPIQNEMERLKPGVIRNQSFRAGDGAPPEAPKRSFVQQVVNFIKNLPSNAYKLAAMVGSRFQVVCRPELMSRI